MRNTPFLPVDPTLCSVDQRWPSDPPPTLGQDLSVLAWLENSRTQLSTACSNYLCGALLEWSLLGELLPDPLEPTPGPDCDHLVALDQLTDRLVRRIADASTVEDRFDLARIGRELSHAIRAQRDPQGLIESRQRELRTRMPRPTGAPTPVSYTGGQQIDDLAAATAQLLATGVVQAPQLVDPHTAMAARDAVGTELRALVGAVADVAKAGEVRDVAMFDVTHRPAQALHQALSELPRVAEFGAGRELNHLHDKALPEYEQAWQAAHRASIGLEAYVDALSQLPDQQAWDVLRDLTDVAAAVPYLDHDLAEAILPRVKAGEDLAIAYRLLSSERHDAVRIVANELRARVQVTQPHARSGRARRTDGGADQPTSGPDGTGDLAEVMIRYTHTVSARSDTLSVADFKAVTRLLQYGSLHAAEVLERPASAVDGAKQAAQDLRAVALLADRLREAPVRSMALPHVDLLRVGGELQTRLEALAGQSRQPPGGAAEHDLRRLAGPAVEFAQHVQALAGALDLSVRETVVHGVMLVPSVAGRRNSGTLSWVTATMGPQRKGPPEVVQRAAQLSVTAMCVAPALRKAAADLAQHGVGKPSPQQSALVAARRHAGAARGELRTALTSRIAAQPSVLAGVLSRNPRIAPPRVLGRER